MVDLLNKEYVVVLQCDSVKQRCPGYFCEKAYHERTGGFAAYPKDKAYRVLYMTCSGCCGRAVHRKLTLLKRRLKKKEGIGMDKIVVQLSSCMTKDNYHAPPCPHLDYIRTLISRIGIDILEDTVISELSEKRRADGVYDD
ncbi:MAG TPA: CGGC domain-containing protein [Anaerohalosphaeraceae bacterium]|nr:CGGC domain-containing protein [Anaerohalosphaeraceae bacterium]HRT50426.1 CGGC domain-containing protein [Anaerohalosphaeraceae bacterium]HRT86356.1 CGGC domain-containing protein [Anaerohalosphaeraceae bacterium]